MNSTQKSPRKSAPRRRTTTATPPRRTIGTAQHSSEGRAVRWQRRLAARLGLVQQTVVAAPDRVRVTVVDLREQASQAVSAVRDRIDRV